MSLNTVCRVCLAMNVPMHVIADSPLQNIYEKLTNTSLNTVHRPVVACNLCYCQLRMCHNLTVRSVRSNRVLTQLLQSGEVKGESFVMLNQLYASYKDTLSITPMTTITAGSEESIGDEIDEEPLGSPCAVEMHTSILIEHLKEEPPDAEDMERAALEHIGNERQTDDIVHEETERGDLNMKTVEFEDAALAPKCMQHADNIQDGRTLKTDGKNILKKLRTIVTDEAMSRKDIANKQDSLNTSDTALNKSIVRVDSDNDCTSTNRDVGNSCEDLRRTFICNECGDVFDNKCGLIKHIARHMKKISCRKRLGRTLGKLRLSIEADNAASVFNCEICQRSFAEKRNLTRHLKIHTGEKRFGCEICGRGFIRKEHLYKHLRTHANEEHFQCEICDIKFNRRGGLNRHLKTHTGQKPYKCEICDGRFSEKGGLNRHLKIHTEEKPFECYICKIRFSQNSNLQRHLKIHTGVKPFECDICKVRFGEKSVLKLHLLSHTGEKPFECKVCKSRFNRRSTLKRHLKTHTAEKPFECNICQKRFSGDLKRHLRTHTELKSTEPSAKSMEWKGAVPAQKYTQDVDKIPDEKTQSPGGENIHKKLKILRTVVEKDATSRSTTTDDSSGKHLDRMFICNDCGAMFNDKYRLIEHIEQHITDRRARKNLPHRMRKRRFSRTGVVDKTKSGSAVGIFKCEICQRIFSDKGGLTRHLIIHSGEKRFRCDICGRGFSRNEHLFKHLRTHTTEERFECEICDIKFNRKESLHKHLTLHVDKKPFKCEICNVRFTEKGTLNRHLNIHTLEKTFECEVCKIRFNRKANLQRHIKVHTGEKPFECDVCKVRFIEKNKLKIHIRSHTGEKPYKCKVCRVRFNRQTTLKRHLKTHIAKKLSKRDRRQRRFSGDLKHRKMTKA